MLYCPQPQFTAFASLPRLLFAVSVFLSWVQSSYILIQSALQVEMYDRLSFGQERGPGVLPLFMKVADVQVSRPAAMPQVLQNCGAVLPAAAGYSLGAHSGSNLAWPG